MGKFAKLKHQHEKEKIDFIENCKVFKRHWNLFTANGIEANMELK